MKSISVHVREADYRQLKALAAVRGKAVAELIREAMTEYLGRERQEGFSLRELVSFPSGAQREDFDRGDYFDELRAGEDS